jgi:hypothetical protein
MKAIGWVVVKYSHRRYMIAALSGDDTTPLYVVQGHLGEYETFEEADQAVRLRPWESRRSQANA